MESNNKVGYGLSLEGLGIITWIVFMILDYFFTQSIRVILEYNLIKIDFC